MATGLCELSKDQAVAFSELLDQGRLCDLGVAALTANRELLGDTSAVFLRGGQ